MIHMMEYYTVIKKHVQGTHINKNISNKEKS